VLVVTGPPVPAVSVQKGVQSVPFFEISRTYLLP